MGETAQAVLQRLRDMRLLDALLLDRTTRRNIIWATDAYADKPGYARTDEIKPQKLFDPEFQLMSRAEKAREAQSQRTRAHAEVFTPLWIVKKMNDYVMADWFGCDEPFTDKPVRFPEGKKWRDFIKLRFLEITCGEAPFLVTRYDVTTGEPIEIAERVGVLDRKLRIVFEHARTPRSQHDYMFQAFKSVYGYELQGDNLLLARINMLLSFEEYMRAYMDRRPTIREYTDIIDVITWNIWQMDGLTGAIPYTAEVPAVTEDDSAQISIDDLDKNGIYQPPKEDKKGKKSKPKAARPAVKYKPCLIKDWQEGSRGQKRGAHTLLFNDLKPTAGPVQLKLA